MNMSPLIPLKMSKYRLRIADQTARLTFQNQAIKREEDRAIQPAHIEGLLAGSARGTDRGENLLTFCERDVAPLARGQGTEMEGTDAHPDQPQGGMTYGSGHSSDLPVFAFAEFEGDPTIRHRFAESDRRIPRSHFWLGIQPLRTRWSGVVALDQQTVFQCPESALLGDSLDLHPVGPPVAGLWIQEPVIQSRFITEQQEPLRIGIQPSQWIHPRRKTKLGQRSIGRSVGGEL